MKRYTIFEPIVGQDTPNLIGRFASLRGAIRKADALAADNGGRRVFEVHDSLSYINPKHVTA